MSQHICVSTYTQPNGKQIEVEVLLGWDRPLQRPFLVVEAADETQDEGVIYSNLDDATGNKDIAYYRKKLLELKIQVPESMFTETQNDMNGNMGNRQVVHSLTETH